MTANKVEQLKNFFIEKFYFDANFDSGNLLKVEVESIRKPNGN